MTTSSQEFSSTNTNTNDHSMISYDFAVNVGKTHHFAVNQPVVSDANSHNQACVKLVPEMNLR